MGYRDLNNRGLHTMRMQQFMQMGGQAQMAPEAKSPMDDLIPAIKSALEQGAPLPQIIVSLAQNQVPMEAIQQALLSAGVGQEEIMQAFQMIQQEQAQAQAQAEQMEGPVQPSAQPQEGGPAQEMAPQQAQAPMPMAQDGEEIGFAQQGQNNAGPTVGGNIPEYQESLVNEEIISERLDENGNVIKDPYEYRKTVDGNTGGVFYERRRKDRKGKYKDWSDAGEEGSKSYRAITDIFGDDKTNWKGSPERADHVAGLKQGYRDMQRKKAEDAINAEKDHPTIDDILSGGYQVKVIQYPYGYGDMDPGHIESVLIDADGNPVTKYYDADNNLQDAFVNRWEERGMDYAMKDDKGGNDNAGVWSRYGEHFEDIGTLNAKLDSDPDIRAADLALNEDQMRSFLASTAGEGVMDYHFSKSNCADGVCRAIGYDDKDSRFANAGITDPLKVMDAILADDNLVKSSVFRKGNRVSADEGLKRLVSKHAGYDMSNASAKEIADYLEGLPEGTADNLLNTATDLKNRWDKSDGFFETAVNLPGMLKDGWNALPDGTIPAVADAARKEVIKKSSDWTGGLIDLDQTLEEGLENTGKWWSNKASQAAAALNPMNWFMDGGSTGRYSNALNAVGYNMINNKEKMGKYLNALNAVRYNNMFKRGGSFDNPGFRALPPAVQQKIMKAQVGGEQEEYLNNAKAKVEQMDAMNDPMNDPNQFLENLPIVNSANQYGELQQSSAADPMQEMQRMILIIQKLKEQNMQMQQQMQQMQQMLQMNEVQEQVYNAPALQKKYRTDSVQKRDGGTVELDTETIAKIMAAGGSVKFS